MIKKRAERNRTISLSEAEVESYLSKCTSHPSSELSPMVDHVIWGDIFEVAKSLPSNSVDLLIVDPPYNLSKIYGDTDFKKMADSEYAAFTEKWLSSLLYTLKSNASIYVCCDWRTGLILGPILQKYFTIQNRITWQREKGRGAKHNWKNSMEDIWFATVSPKQFTFNVDNVKMRRKVMAPYKVDGKPKDWVESEFGNFRDTFPSNFWDDISIPYWSMPENTNHPTQKPEKLIAKLILASSNPGDIVLDPFGGSGTTAVVAKKLKRHYVTVEIEKEYCALIQKRLQMAEASPKIQGYTDKIFWERNTLSLQQKAETQKRSSTGENQPMK